MLLYNTVAEVLANLINADKMIKGIQIGDHDIKMVHFADITTIFLRDITYLNRIQVTLKPYENGKINWLDGLFFQKAKALWAVAYKN